MRIARLASLLALVAGVILGWGLLFGPFFYGCTTTAVAPGQAAAPQVCSGSSLIEVQGSDHLFPAPLLWILMWSLAPALAVIGVWMSRRPRIWLIAIALLMELTGVISLGGGIIFALVIEPLLLITLVASLRARAQMG
ncbi:MAG TPA: hypothetical protein VIP07_07555 [Candidatus Limnocylindria bacterium]